MDELQQIRADETLRKIISDLEVDCNSHQGYMLVQNRLMHKERVVLPKGAPLITTLLNEYHNGLVGGHSGVLKTYKRIGANFYWKGMRKEIEQYVAACTTC